MTKTRINRTYCDPFVLTCKVIVIASVTPRIDLKRTIGRVSQAKIRDFLNPFVESMTTE